MSEETKVATETASEGTTPQTPTETPDAGSLIAESKKYRQRSQDAEAQLAKLQAKLEQQDNAKLKEKEEFKTLADKFESQVNELSPFKEKYETMVNIRKQKLLERLPEDKRDTFKDKDIDVLEFMVDNISQKDNIQPSARGSLPKNQEFGGYKTMAEWAMKDPDACNKHLTENVSGYQWGKVK